MNIEVIFSSDPNWVLSEAKGYLHSDPVHNNLILSMLQRQSDSREDGRYWVVKDSSTVVGVVIQTPLNSRALITPIQPNYIRKVVEAISEMNIPLPGIGGEVGTVACFSGEWAENNKTPVFPFLGLRLYEVDNIQDTLSIDGSCRKAGRDNQELFVDWVSRFSVDTGQQKESSDPEEIESRKLNSTRIVDMHLSAGNLWVWENPNPVSMAVQNPPIAGVVRIEMVYTPTENRKCGYATACVGHISKEIRNQGHRCILYTDLENPNSNSIYRKIGYHAVADIIQYRFG